MIDKQFTVVLTAAQLNLIGGAIEQVKAALDVVALDIQKQVNAHLVAEAQDKLASKPRKRKVA